MATNSSIQPHSILVYDGGQHGSRRAQREGFLEEEPSNLNSK